MPLEKGNTVGVRRRTWWGSQRGRLPGKEELAVSRGDGEWGRGALAGWSKRQERQACPQRRSRAGSSECRVSGAVRFARTMAGPADWQVY